MNRPVTDTNQMETRIEGNIDKDAMALTEISSTAGGLAFKDMGQVMEFAKLMSVARQAVPKHLRGQPGACMAVSLQALNWRMDPFAVANKSYMVNDRIAYEAQLIHAVIEQRAPITGRIQGTVSGEGPTRKWTLTAHTTNGDKVVFEGNEIGNITTKNSPLWKSDPDQQLWFYSVRAMCRRHFPDVLLGVYEKEEIAHAEGMRDVTPEAGKWAEKALKARAPEPEPDEEIHDAITGEILPDEEPAPTVEYDEDAVQPITDAYDEGFKASQAAMMETMNPHEPGSEEWNNWIGGFRFHAANKDKAEDEA